jgi:hypothetical protein
MSQFAKFGDECPIWVANGLESEEGERFATASRCPWPQALLARPLGLLLKRVLPLPLLFQSFDLGIQQCEPLRCLMFGNQMQEILGLNRPCFMPKRSYTIALSTSLFAVGIRNWTCPQCSVSVLVIGSTLLS